jgi:hypothetical protein
VLASLDASAQIMPIWEDAVRDGLVRIENGVTAVNRPTGASTAASP